jgi:hypothetical protein
LTRVANIIFNKKIKHTGIYNTIPAREPHYFYKKKSSARACPCDDFILKKNSIEMQNKNLRNKIK